jgi:genome maintenance exonuclease 1
MNNPNWSDRTLPIYYAKPARRNGMSGYEDERGNFQPSVSHIQEVMRSLKEKARLNQWRRSQGAAANRACQIGKLGHRLVENFLKGETVSCPPILEPHWKQLLPTLQKIHGIRLVESPVFHHYDGYCGRVDCVARLSALPEMAIEFKFSDRIKPIYPQQKMQLAAYTAALNRQYGTQFNQGLIVVATPDTIDVNLIDSSELNQSWRQWQSLVARFWAQDLDVA